MLYPSSQNIYLISVSKNVQIKGPQELLDKSLVLIVITIKMSILFQSIESIYFFNNILSSCDEFFDLLGFSDILVLQESDLEFSSKLLRSSFSRPVFGVKEKRLVQVPHFVGQRYSCRHTRNFGC